MIKEKGEFACTFEPYPWGFVSLSIAAPYMESLANRDGQIFPYVRIRVLPQSSG